VNRKRPLGGGPRVATVVIEVALSDLLLTEMTFGFVETK
jgi:hypothetical protein